MNLSTLIYVHAPCAKNQRGPLLQRGLGFLRKSLFGMAREVSHHFIDLLKNAREDFVQGVVELFAL